MLQLRTEHLPPPHLCLAQLHLGWDRNDGRTKDAQRIRKPNGADLELAFLPRTFGVGGGGGRRKLLLS